MVKILAVGNSFSRNALRFFGDIAAGAGDKVVSAHAMIGGCSFERHMRHVDAFDTDSDDPEGRPYQGNSSLRDLLTLDTWEYVTIQQASRMSFLPETFQPHADHLIEYIRKHAPQADIVIHQTWAYREDHSFWGRDDMNPDVMYRGLRAAYDGFARRTGFRQIPSGDAMEAARRDSKWGRFEPDTLFDPATAVFPDLPEERRSLHQGYSWRTHPDTGEQILGMDGYHANTQGEFLLGCVWYAFFFDGNAMDRGFVPTGIREEDAATLRRIAYRVVKEKQRPEL